MLPTRESIVGQTILKFEKSGKLERSIYSQKDLMAGTGLLKDQKFQPHFLYFTTDSEIKEGDWYIDDCNLIRQAVTSDKDYWDRRPTYKKIVTSTDKSLGLPQPSQAFIQKHCELGGIDEVDLEYEVIDKGFINALKGNHNYDYRLKVDSHNTITIHSIKDSWGREEVIELLSKLNHTLNIGSELTFEEWLKENL